MNNKDRKSTYLHICIITTIHNRRDVRIYKKEALSLVKAGYGITLIAPGVDQVFEDGVLSVPIMPVRNKLYRGLSNVRTLIKAITQKADIYHFHDPDFLIFAVLLRIISGRKIIFDVHEDFEKVLLERDWILPVFRGAVVSSYRLMKRLCLRYFYGIISATEHIDSTIQHPNKIIIHNYPFPAESVKPSVKRPLSIIYIGGLTRIRGISTMLSAVQQARKSLPVTVDLYGGFEDMAYEQELISQFQCDYIRFKGFIDYQELLIQAREYQVGIITYLPFPNHVEAMPTKLFEYLMLGLPVIASDFPLWKSIIEGNHCGMTCDPQNINEIADRIIQIFSDQDRLVKFGKNSRNNALQKYSWKPEERKLINFYRNIRTIP